MFHFFRNKHPADDSGGEPKKDRRYLIALALLSAFVGFSIVTGIHGGGVQQIVWGFRFHYTDIAVTVALAAAYLIYRIKGGRGHDK